MKLHYRVGSIFWLLIGLYVAIVAYKLGVGTFNQPGRGFIFFLAALLLMIFSAIDLARIFIGKRKNDQEENPLWSDSRWQRVLLTIGGLSSYIYLLRWLGFSLSTFLLMFFLLKAMESKKWGTAILFSLLVTAASYSFFKLWLKVPFPPGILGF
jgi:hypothetical protein